MKIFPSLPAQNIPELSTMLTPIEPYVNGYHIDIMDGQYVPRISGSINLIHTYQTITQKPLWIHLMTVNPENFITRMKLKPADIVSFHYEATRDYQSTINAINARNAQPSIALDPSTSPEVLIPFFDMVKHILIMGVKPGASGQAFLQSTYKKLDALFCLIKKESGMVLLL